MKYKMDVEYGKVKKPKPDYKWEKRTYGFKTEQELKSNFGWDTLAQVQKYTRSARQKIGAESGIVHLNLKRRENESA